MGLRRGAAALLLVAVYAARTDMDSHRIEKRVVEELVRSGRKVRVGIEMYPYTAQAALDDWTAGKREGVPAAVPVLLRREAPRAKPPAP